jgi:hypothetical protein
VGSLTTQICHFGARDSFVPDMGKTNRNTILICQKKNNETIELYGGTKVTCVCFYLSRGHERAKSWPRES